MMLSRLSQMIFFFEFYVIISFGNDQLLCYSCKGLECEQTTNKDQIICDKKTQLCWVKKKPKLFCSI